MCRHLIEALRVVAPGLGGYRLGPLSIPAWSAAFAEGWPALAFMLLGGTRIGRGVSVKYDVPRSELCP